MHTKQTSTRRLLARAAAGLALGLGMAPPPAPRPSPSSMRAARPQCRPIRPRQSCWTWPCWTRCTRWAWTSPACPPPPLPPQLEQYADKRYLKVGSMFEPNYEVIHAAAPQVIFVAGRSAPKYDELSRLAPTVDLTVDAGPGG